MSASPNSSSVKILFDHAPVLVVNKPGGLLTQAPPGVDSIEVRVKQFLKQRDATLGTPYLGLAHRLDRPASGLMVMATNKAATNHLSRQFEYRSVAKRYWALVEGQVENDQGTWSDFMRKIEDEARSEIVDHQAERAQFAVLNFRVLFRNSDWSWIEIELETGRTHQIRLQCAHRGHPILGDELYGSKLPFGPQLADMRQRWIALHSRSLRFEHPTVERVVEIESPLFEYWRHIPIPLEQYQAALDVNSNHT